MTLETTISRHNTNKHFINQLGNTPYFLILHALLFLHIFTSSTEMFATDTYTYKLT